MRAYGAKESDRKHQADSEAYYVNAKYRNVVSSASHIKTPVKDGEDAEHLTFALDQDNLSRFMLVEAKGGSYHNIRIKQEHNLEHVKLQAYYRTKYYYLFFFTLANEKDKLERKHSYFAVRKTLQEVEDMGYDNHQSIIQMDLDVTVFMPYSSLSTDKSELLGFTRKMTFEQLIEF